MSETGPYAHLNALSESQKKRVYFFSKGSFQNWPTILAQNPESSQWFLVPVDPAGFPRLDLSDGAKSSWKTMDPTDQTALMAAGVDSGGFPHDHSSIVSLDACVMQSRAG